MALKSILKIYKYTLFLDRRKLQIFSILATQTLPDDVISFQNIRINFSLFFRVRQTWEILSLALIVTSSASSKELKIRATEKPQLKLTDVTHVLFGYSFFMILNLYNNMLIVQIPYMSVTNWKPFNT